MKLARLQEIEDEQRQEVIRIGRAAAPDGYVENIRAIYPKMYLPRRFAFYRRGAPLAALMLLYEKCVVYIPPAGTAELHQRCRMSFDLLMDYAESGAIQPVVGHPVDYASGKHFDRLFELKPPSVWARGDELAQSFAGGPQHWDRARSLLSIDRYADLGWLRAKWRRHFPNLSENELTNRLHVELCTNFVDLCIFGYEPLAEAIARETDASFSAEKLLEMSELLTYPFLMGIGGTPNYGFESPEVIQAARAFAYTETPVPKHVGFEADILLKGLNIDVATNAGPDIVRQFHADGMAKRLWASLEELEVAVARPAPGKDANSLIDTSIRAEGLIKDALREINAASKEARRATIRTNSRSHNKGGVCQRRCLSHIRCGWSQLAHGGHCWPYRGRILGYRACLRFRSRISQPPYCREADASASHATCTSALVARGMERYPHEHERSAAWAGDEITPADKIGPARQAPTIALTADCEQVSGEGRPAIALMSCGDQTEPVCRLPGPSCIWRYLRSWPCRRGLAAGGGR